MDCLFCDSEAKESNYSGNGIAGYKVECPSCGTFYISDIIHDRDQDTVKRYEPYKHLISGVIREKNELGIEMNIILTDNIISIINDPLVPKTIRQQLDKVLLYFYRNTKEFGQSFEITKEIPYSIGYAHNYDEFVEINVYYPSDHISASFL